MFVFLKSQAFLRPGREYTVNETPVHTMQIKPSVKSCKRLAAACNSKLQTYNLVTSSDLKPLHNQYHEQKHWTLDPKLREE